MGRRHRGQGDDERRHRETGERECCDSHAAPPAHLRLGADFEAFVDRPRRQLSAEEEQHGHERGAPGGAASGGGNGGDIRCAGEEERCAKAAAAEDERGDEQHRPEAGAGYEREHRRGGTGERVHDGAAVGGQRSCGECYAGLAILATNMKGHIDAAFLRRLRYVVDVPFPDATARRLIWQKSIPAEMPCASRNLQSGSRHNRAYRPARSG